MRIFSLRSKLNGNTKRCTYVFLLEVVGVDEGVLGAEQDAGDEFLVGQRVDLVVVGERVVLGHCGVYPTRIYPLGFGSPSTSVPSVHWTGNYWFR